jgi:hypothetical protein
MTLTDLLENPVGLAYKLIGGVIFLAAIFISGMLTDRAYFNKYKGEVKGLAEAQGKITKAADIKNKESADVSLEQYHKDTKAINDWYHAHPVVRVQHDGSCNLPKAPDSPPRPDGTATGQYVTAYDPAEVERVASRLFNLQQRLIAAGVIVQ